METEKSFSGEEAEKDFCGRLFFLAAIFPFSNEKACLGVTAKTDFFYRLKRQASQKLDAFLVPVAGLEPARRKHQRILSPPCLPFHHTGKYLIILALRRKNVNHFGHREHPMRHKMQGGEAN